MDEKIKVDVLRAILRAGDGVAGRIVSIADLKEFTSIDLSTVRYAIIELLMDKCLLCGRTEGQVCLSREGGLYLQRHADAQIRHNPDTSADRVLASSSRAGAVGTADPLRRVFA